MSATQVAQLIMQQIRCCARWHRLTSLAERVACRSLEKGVAKGSGKVRAALGVKRPKRRYHVLRKEPQHHHLAFDVLDCTFGEGVCASTILAEGEPYTRVAALDVDVETAIDATAVVERFGTQRFRFFANPMSQSLSMFGESSFDAVVIDPGPNTFQLKDPCRGFCIEEGHNGCLDLRYSQRWGTSALQLLNQTDTCAIAVLVSHYGLLSLSQATRVARALVKRRPFVGSEDLMDAIEEIGGEVCNPFSTQSSSSISQSNRMLLSLRMVVNNEWSELREAVRNATILLRDCGRLFVVTYVPWEADVVSTIVAQDPECFVIGRLSCYEGTSTPSLICVMKNAKASFRMKNVSLDEDSRKQSIYHHLAGVGSAARERGFPYENVEYTPPPQD